MPVKATIKIGNQGADYFSILADVLNELEHHTLVVFDELTVLLESLLGKDNDEQAVRTFLNLFRALRSATSECTNYILNKIGWNIPFFIQLILSRLPVGKATEADVDAAYDSLLQTGSFDTWHERLDREYGKNNKSSKLILQYLCISLEGKTRDEVFNHTHAVYPEMDTYEFGLLMRALITDGYLVNVGGRYKFRSPLLRDYWKVTYC